MRVIPTTRARLRRALPAAAAAAVLSLTALAAATGPADAAEIGRAHV